MSDPLPESSTQRRDLLALQTAIDQSNVRRAAGSIWAAAASMRGIISGTQKNAPALAAK